MISVLLAGGISMMVAMLGTPLFIRFLVRRGYGQFIRDDGPTAHHMKRGTPTMGGVVIIAATLCGYAGAHVLILVVDALNLVGLSSTRPTMSGLLVLFLMSGLGLVGFFDDYIKISKQRSLGLRSWEKLLGQTSVAVIFAVLALQFPADDFRRPASTAVSFVRDTSIDFAMFGAVGGLVLFVVWANIMIAGASNGVNLADGLDGLATGASVMVFGSYLLIGIWQYNQNCQISPGPNCYDVRDALDVAVVASCVAGACFGFLWWNASPAKIFMGDTGSLALGGALAGLAVVTHTQLLMAILGGLFVIITLSVIIQVGSFKMTGKRVFRMAPLQHHFELLGWAEVTIVIRFWIVAGLCVALGLGVFYAEWVARL